jgi:hypothetical protein
MPFNECVLMHMNVIHTSAIIEGACVSRMFSLQIECILYRYNVFSTESMLSIPMQCMRTQQHSALLIHVIHVIHESRYYVRICMRVDFGRAFLCHCFCGDAGVQMYTPVYIHVCTCIALYT